MDRARRVRPPSHPVSSLTPRIGVVLALHARTRRRGAPAEGIAHAWPASARDIGRLPHVADKHSGILMRTGARQPGEVREHLDAFGRLVVLAAKPYPSRPALNATVLAAALAAVPAGIGWIAGNLLVGLVVLLSAAVLLLLIAGTRIERQFHGDSGIRLEPRMANQWIRLEVWNDRSKTAEFTGTVESVVPVPPPGPPGWVIPWYVSSGQSIQTIEPHGMRHLVLGHGEITRRDRGQELAGSIAFLSAGHAEIPFNYENASQFDVRKSIRITVKVRRHDPPASIEQEFLIEFPGLDGGLPLHPTIIPDGEPRSTRG